MRLGVKAAAAIGISSPKRSIAVAKYYDPEIDAELQALKATQTGLVTCCAKPWKVSEQLPLAHA